MQDTIEFPIRKLGGSDPKLPSEVAATKGLVCGVQGIPYGGKTTCVETLLTDPECYPVLGMQFDGGFHVVRDSLARGGRLQIQVPKDWNHLMQMLDEIERDPKPFKTIWADTINCATDENIAQHHVHEAPTSDKRERQIRWGESNWDVVRFHKRMMTIAEKHGINVFFVYWSTRPQVVENSDIRIATQHIALSQTLSLKITGMLDLIVHIEKAPGNKPYPPQMVMDGIPSIETKVRLSPDNPLKKWPTKIQNPSFAKMVRAFHGEIFTDFSPESPQVSG